MQEERLRDMLRRFQNGDHEVGRELVEQMGPLVSALAGRMAYTPAEVDDYYQVGMIGLLKAAQRYNLDAPVKFITYAVAWIRGEMRSYRRGNQSTVKVSRSLRTQSFSLSSYRERLMQTLQREPTVSELARAMNTTAEEIVMVMDAALPVSTLEEDLPAAPEGVSEEEQLIDRISLYDGVMRLAPMERQIIVLRFFKETTQSEIARRLTLSQRQVSRLEKRALWQLREYLQA